MMNTEVWDWIRFACDCNACPEAADLIRLEWSSRMTSSMGHIWKKSNEDHYVLKLSVKLFKRASEAEKRQTVIHETCHIIDGYTRHARMSHGYGWATCMQRADCEPDVYHSVNNAGLVKRFIYSCSVGCAVEHRLSSRKHNSIVKGRYRICNRCRKRIRYTGRVE